MVARLSKPPPDQAWRSRWDRVHPMFGGRFRVSDGKKEGHVDWEGEVTPPAVWTYAGSFFLSHSGRSEIVERGYSSGSGYATWLDLSGLALDPDQGPFIP